jgi:hypothetical protein
MAEMRSSERGQDAQWRIINVVKILVKNWKYNVSI